MSSINKKRMVLAFTILSILLVVLTFRVGWVQIVKGGKYADMAKQEQKKDMPIEAKRGSIYDCHGQVLALSAVTNTIWARPTAINSGRSDKKAKYNYDNAKKALTEVLGLTEDKAKEILESDKNIVKVAKYVDKDKADKIRKKIGRAHV